MDQEQTVTRAYLRATGMNVAIAGRLAQDAIAHLDPETEIPAAVLDTLYHLAARVICLAQTFQQLASGEQEADNGDQ